MASHQIRLNEQAYQLLGKVRSAGDTYSDAVLKMAKLGEFADCLAAVIAEFPNDPDHPREGGRA